MIKIITTLLLAASIPASASIWRDSTSINNPPAKFNEYSYRKVTKNKNVVDLTLEIEEQTVNECAKKYPYPSVDFNNCKISLFLKKIDNLFKDANYSLDKTFAEILKYLKEKKQEVEKTNEYGNVNLYVVGFSKLTKPMVMLFSIDPAAISKIMLEQEYFTKETIELLNKMAANNRS